MTHLRFCSPELGHPVLTDTDQGVPQGVGGEVHHATQVAVQQAVVLLLPFSGVRRRPGTPEGQDVASTCSNLCSPAHYTFYYVLVLMVIIMSLCSLSMKVQKRSGEQSVSCSQEDCEELAGDGETGELTGPVSPVHQPQSAPSSEAGEGTAVLGEAGHHGPPLLSWPRERPVCQVVQVEQWTPSSPTGHKLKLGTLLNNFEGFLGLEDSITFWGREVMFCPY